MATLTKENIQMLAARLETCELEAKDLVKITDEFPDLTLEEAYDIQYEIRRRKLDAGHKLAGLKMGLTSWAKMKQMGVESPIYAFLVDYFAVPDGGEIQTKELIHPKVEVEVAFFTSKEIAGPGVSAATVMAATDFVVPAIEIIDSRYRDFKFDLPSVIADNASSARFVTGGAMRRPADLDLRNLGVVLYVNGQVKATGAAAAVVGHPATSVAILANMLAKRGETIPAGTFILTGGITEAIAVNAGDSVVARAQDLGSIHCRFV